MAEAAPDPDDSPDSVQVITGLDAVRKRPGMYIGNTGDGSGLHQMVCEVVENAIDEALPGRAPAVTVTLNPDGSVTVTDNGRGVPTGPHLQDSVVCGGLHAVGVTVVNALSTSLELRIWREGKEQFIAFVHGNAVAPLKVVGAANGKHGTEVTFTPSPQIFSIMAFDFATLERRLREFAALNSGVTIVLSDRRQAVERRAELRSEAAPTVS